VFFLPNPGNGGDAFINVGFFDLARSLGVEYTVTDGSTELSGDDVLILAGGGNLVPEYPHMAAMLRRYAPVVGRLIVLPQSVRGHEDVLRALGPNVHLFVREHVSLDYCRQVGGQAHVVFDNDMAFHADIEALRRRRGWAGFRLTRANVARVILLGWLALRAHGTRTLLAFRTDREAPSGSKARLRNDVSKLSTFGTATVAQCYFSASRFIRAIDRYQRVETDRLHVAIAGALLGKEVVLHDNSYWKCRAVYEASLTGYDVKMAQPRQSGAQGPA
jgi:exopolysaccharide biosynthesis predicted pyruvyltransferase EpsI